MQKIKRAAEMVKQRENSEVARQADLELPGGRLKLLGRCRRERHARPPAAPRPRSAELVLRLSSNVLARAARSSTERVSARFRRSETSGLMALFYPVVFTVSITYTRFGFPGSIWFFSNMP